MKIRSGMSGDGMLGAIIVGYTVGCLHGWGYGWIAFGACLVIGAGADREPAIKAEAH